MQLLIAVLVIAVCYLLWKNNQQVKKKKQPISAEKGESEKEATGLTSETIKHAYQKKWMFTYNEKDAYRKLLEIVTPMGCTVFAKVRLFDLVEPIKQNPKYKTFLYKIQAKHVDFVICDQKLVAKYIIELDDNSHNSESRKVRDQFVDTVLESTGYKILHTKAITKEEIEKFIFE